MMNTQTTDDIKYVLDSLLALQKKLEKIEDIKLDKVNVFDAVGMRTQEIKHSAFLAWLLSPKAPHKLGNTALKLFLEHLIPHTFADTMFEKERRTNAEILKEIAVTSTDDFEELYSDDHVTIDTEVVVFRDKNEKDGRIDIIIESEKANTVILIENKVFTGTHDNQLGRYVKGFEGSTRRVIYVYLTPYGNTPEDFGKYRKEWCVCSYQTILQIAQQILKELPHTKENRRLKYLLEDYIEIVNTEILRGNKQIRELCKEILRDHAEALEILKSFTDQSEQVITICKSYLKEKLGSEIKFVGNVTSGNLDFYTPKAKQYFDQLDGGFKQNGRYKFLYQIRKGGGYKYCWYINKVAPTWTYQQKVLAEQNGKSLIRRQDGEEVEKTSFVNLCQRTRFLKDSELYTELDEQKVIDGLDAFIKEIHKFEDTYFSNL